MAVFSSFGATQAPQEGSDTRILRSRLRTVRWTSVTLTDILLAVARGNTEPRVLADLGIVLQGEPGGYRIEDDPTEPLVELSFRDLAQGFLHHWALGTSLPECSATILLASCFVMPEITTTDENTLIEALWDASFGEFVSDEAVDVARRMGAR